MRALSNSGLNTDALGLAEADRKTASLDFWIDLGGEEGAGDFAAGPAAAATLRVGSASETSPINATDMNSDNEIEALEIQSPLVSKVNKAALALRAPIGKAERRCANVAASGANYADALKAFNVGNDCIKQVLNASSSDFEKYKKRTLEDKAAVFPLERQVSEELGCVAALLSTVGTIGSRVETRRGARTNKSSRL